MKKMLLGLFIVLIFGICHASEKYKNKNLYSKLDNFSNDNFDFEDFSGAWFHDINCSNSSFCYCDFFSSKFTKSNFTNSDLRYSRFCGAQCYNVIFNNANLKVSWFLNCDLTKSDFSNSKLNNSAMFDSNIIMQGEDRTIVDNADFDGVIGLTNAQKKYLRESGAINVPDDLTDDQFKKEKEVFYACLDEITEELSFFYPFKQVVKWPFKKTWQVIQWISENIKSIRT
ncbi:MAG: Pentapeptide repeat protein [candidate division TM6 bacterium GW2011_GWF2_28_16]|nr:MAG: Pentapeptide repeat protein [candidate division TM6 bacterium GW2011_GWF2_28_16]